jgi:hypothetical protein
MNSPLDRPLTFFWLMGVGSLTTAAAAAVLTLLKGLL